MELLVNSPFRDKYNTENIYQKGDVVETEDLDRINDLVSRKLCVIQSLTSPKSGDENQNGKSDEKDFVAFGDKEYEVEQMKEALKAIGVEVHHSCGEPGVSKKIANLTEEQIEQLSAKLSE